MSLLLLSLLGFGLLAFGPDIFDDDNDDDDATSPDEPLPPEEPDLGASVIEEDGVVTVELGEDETGSLAMVIYVDTEDAGIGLAEYHEARLYLVPEGSEIPEGEGGIFDGAGLPSMFELDDMEDALGLEMLACWDLGEVQPIDTEPYITSTLVDPPEIVTDDPLGHYYIEANTDGDDIVSIRAFDDQPVPPQFTTITYTVDGQTQILRASSFNMFGGTDADETIVTEGGDLTLRGQGGDDTISVYQASVYGGPGDDVLENDPDGGPTVLRGSRGDDQIFAYDSDTNASGGLGNDAIHLFDGAWGVGGEGDDVITIHEGGGVAFGGAGNDVLIATPDGVADTYTEFTGGEGADTFAMSATDPAVTPGQGEVIVMDFDPSNDILQVRNANAIGEVRILDSAGNDALVEVDIEAPDETGALRDETLRFLLIGAPAVTAGHVTLAPQPAA